MVQGFLTMAALSDHDYRIEMQKGEILIEPLPNQDQFQPASVDLRLGREFIRFRNCAGTEATFLDVARPDNLPEEFSTRIVADTFLLDSKEFALGVTAENVSIPKTLLANVEGRSSLGRIGLAVHVTAGFIDPGFSGNITLELYNHFPVPILLRSGMRVCQIAFERLETPCTVPYCGKYQRQSGVQPSRIEQDFLHGLSTGCD